MRFQRGDIVETDRPYVDKHGVVRAVRFIEALPDGTVRFQEIDGPLHSGPSLLVPRGTLAARRSVLGQERPELFAPSTWQPSDVPHIESALGAAAYFCELRTSLKLVGYRSFATNLAESWAEAVSATGVLRLERVAGEISAASWRTVASQLGAHESMLTPYACRVTDAEVWDLAGERFLCGRHAIGSWLAVAFTCGSGKKSFVWPTNASVVELPRTEYTLLSAQEMFAWGVGTTRSEALLRAALSKGNLLAEETVCGTGAAIDALAQAVASHRPLYTFIVTRAPSASNVEAGTMAVVFSAAGEERLAFTLPSNDRHLPVDRRVPNAAPSSDDVDRARRWVFSNPDPHDLSPRREGVPPAALAAFQWWLWASDADIGGVGVTSVLFEGDTFFAVCVTTDGDDVYFELYAADGRFLCAAISDPPIRFFEDARTMREQSFLVQCARENGFGPSSLG